MRALIGAERVHASLRVPGCAMRGLGRGRNGALASGHDDDDHDDDDEGIPAETTYSSKLSNCSEFLARALLTLLSVSRNETGIRDDPGIWPAWMGCDVMGSDRFGSRFAGALR